MFNKFLIYLVLVFFLNGCNTIRQGISPDKRSGEEFLVEKKSPLVMPPSYNELPIPKEINENLEVKKTDVKALISGSSVKQDKDENNESISSIEKLILKKIKKN